MALSEAEGRQVAGAVTVNSLAREGQDHPGGDDAIFLNQHSPIVQGGISGKQIE